MRMFKYSAETLATDFTHRTRGVPASGNSVLLELPGFADPASRMRFQKVDVADQCLNCVRTWRNGWIRRVVYERFKSIEGLLREYHSDSGPSFLFRSLAYTRNLKSDDGRKSDDGDTPL